MQVENSECEIAQAQFGNYLSGSGLTQEAIETLESHVDGCVPCKEALQKKRERLRSLLGTPTNHIDFAKIAQEAEVMQTRSISTALRKQSLQRMLEQPPEPTVEDALDTVEPEVEMVVEPTIEVPEIVLDVAQTLPRRRNLSPAYAIALVVVLVGGIVFAANSESILSTQPTEDTLVSSSQHPIPVANVEPPAAPTLTPTVPEPEKEVWVPLEGYGSPESSVPKTEVGKTEVVKPPAAPVQVTKPTVRKWTRRKPVRRPVRRSSARRSGVRVYNP